MGYSATREYRDVASLLSSGPQLGPACVCRVAVTIGWAYMAARIHSDYVQTLESERNHLRGVGATLRSATLAMLNDGVGAAVAGANELQSAGGINRDSSADLTTTLQKQLTGGDYARFQASLTPVGMRHPQA